MGIIGWIILGLLAGIIAKAILPGDDPGGIIVTTLIGIAGAFIGGLITKALGFGDPIDEFCDRAASDLPHVRRPGTEQNRLLTSNRPEGRRGEPRRPSVA